MKAVLCYVKDNFAYFTTQSLKDQWGDDWDDVPYQHNAECPYEWMEKDGLGCVCINPKGFRTYGRNACGEKGHNPIQPKDEWEIIKVAFDGDVHTPEDSYSVEDINSGKVPWLFSNFSTPNIKIWAGVRIDRFCELVKKAGGEVYISDKYVTEIEEDAYIRGLTAYAWWKDGLEYVGTCGTTLKEAINRYRKERK